MIGRRVCVTVAVSLLAGGVCAQELQGQTGASSDDVAPIDMQSVDVRPVGSADAFTPDPSGIFGIDEIRFGAFGQIAEGYGETEDGAYAQFEALFSKPSWVFENPIFDLFFRPRPHIGASLNTSGDTSQAFAGMTWDVWLNDRFFLEGSLGLALHDGVLDGPASGQPALGCRVLFREGAAAGVALSPNWRVVASLGHSSNGGACDEDDGITQAGVSLGYSF